ncbi:YjjG family noncanonical pyrimidine nucleotidase [Maribacter antarcticus]|uniref:YjjG family noncanonical pyrimidine nucleotidase n=1 Tax=Maribacter antarcticus TaxID=505250 RepID=UPI0004789231|nr:YjjG family noncanonical pyrimidine nucleotidase [Maribacter antarcticus]
MFKDVVTDVFFDLDHTLWDFEKNSALTFEMILPTHDITVPLESFLEVYVPANLVFWKMYREEKITKEDLRYQRLKSVFDTLEYAVSDDCINSLANEYINQLSSHTYLFPNALEVLDYLKPNYKLHIITNGFQEIQEKKLRNSGIYPYFEQVIDSEMAGVKKPDPFIFNLALEKAKVRPESALMIGDSLEADILGAKGVGIHTLHFNAHGEAEHQHSPMISELWEIKTYL